MNVRPKERISVRKNRRSKGILIPILSLLNPNIEAYRISKSVRFYYNRYPLSRVSFKRILENTKVDLHVGKFSASESPISVYITNPKFQYRVSIGNYTHIGTGLKLILSRNHTPDLVSNNTSQLQLQSLSEELNSEDQLYYNYYNENYGDIEIGNDVWVGNDVIIRGGVKLGNGCVIGTGSFISRDVPPYGIAAGNPSKLIRMRFSRQIIDRLESLKWWETDIRDLVLRKELLYDVERFIDEF